MKGIFLIEESGDLVETNEQGYVTEDRRFQLWAREHASRRRRWFSPTWLELL
jgi:hypothetical protein